VVGRRGVAYRAARARERGLRRANLARRAAAVLVGRQYAAAVVGRRGAAYRAARARERGQPRASLARWAAAVLVGRPFVAAVVGRREAPGHIVFRCDGDSGATARGQPRIRG